MEKYRKTVAGMLSMSKNHRFSPIKVACVWQMSLASHGRTQLTASTANMQADFIPLFSTWLSHKTLARDHRCELVHQDLCMFKPPFICPIVSFVSRPNAMRHFLAATRLSGTRCVAASANAIKSKKRRTKKNALQKDRISNGSAALCCCTVLFPSRLGTEFSCNFALMH